MCGIVGYIGDQNCCELLLAGLKKLEYRGYDSAGIALANKNEMIVFKEAGRIADLRKVITEHELATVGIGHTRWATHGAPCANNAHPHLSSLKRFAIVHNGVIDNYKQLQDKYLSKISLKSDTDTEIIVCLIEHFVNLDAEKNVEKAFVKTLNLLKGSFALALIDQQNIETIYVAKNKSPLLIGVGNNCHVVASDAMAMLHITNKFVQIEDHEFVILKQNDFHVKSISGEIVKKRLPFIAEIDENDLEKGTYEHFMLKEIDEQAVVIRTLLQKYRDEFGELAINPEIVEKTISAERIYMVACGTSYHAALVGKVLFESIAKIPVEVHIASEFSYNPPLFVKNPLFIFLTQSGETADSRSALVLVKKLGYTSVTITNVFGSTLSREADYTLLLHAGPEIAVASTKAYTAQIAMLLIYATVIATKKEIFVPFNINQELSIAANAIESICQEKDTFKGFAKEYLKDAFSCFFIGRGLDMCVCLEAALKLKEISYILAEGFAAGELKHGTIALIEDNTPVVTLISQEHVSMNIRSNINEVVARGAKPLNIVMSGLNIEGDHYVIPKVHSLLAPLVMVVPLQLLSYYGALLRDCDIDKPRNLAKSVTVE